MLEKRKKAFFDELAMEANYIDPETAKAVYVAMARLLLKKLRYKGEYELPDFGKFVIKEYKGLKIRNVNTGEMEALPPTKVLGFEADYKLKKYIKGMTTRTEGIIR